MSRYPRFIGSMAAMVLGRLAPIKFKSFMEFRYWRRRFAQEGELRNSHYEFFYTDFFGLSKDDYVGRRVLDIGCGPRGSLEWVSGNAECTGLDPLVSQYKKLGIEKHKMRYVEAGAENIPFENGRFDIVTSFNNLDHVDDVKDAISEIKRVTASGGIFLLVTEVEHGSTATEPQNLPKNVASLFEPEFEIVSQGICSVRSDHDIYQSLRDGSSFKVGEEGVVFARFCRR